ncbi:hypothetical protein C7B77_00335 [Chamaesiphon polymorphus CCALA 037]|uniref:Uncharacterized protein n=1 Tax=Chamaesiphon polymorphus CCALA 037 TaxID=2107692 RepID=A0A2T1GP02_9CYAN|nr:hypothetical protein C7B77_00335 [Chamaesiphon polymorphus CCALA 037]
MQIALFNYKIFSHNGNLHVQVNESDSDDIVIAKAQAQLYSEVGTELPSELVSFTIIKRTNES